jgi:hypothetical protein
VLTTFVTQSSTHQGASKKIMSKEADKNIIGLKI